MPKQQLTATVTWLAIGDIAGTLVTRPVPTLTLDWQGVVGDSHAGQTRKADVRVPHYPRGSQIRNERQVTIVAADELAALDQKACDMCGITFFEFRNQGRLGCPHDYVQFAKELEPLISNIHGATEHTGRKPLRSQQTAAAAEGSAELTGLIGIRREMKEAISREDYEKAKENRDAIRAIEDRWIPPARPE
jgi:protein arginine kinase activator